MTPTIPGSKFEALSVRERCGALCGSPARAAQSPFSLRGAGCGAALLWLTCRAAFVAVRGGAMISARFARYCACDLTQVSHTLPASLFNTSVVSVALTFVSVS